MLRDGILASCQGAEREIERKRKIEDSRKTDRKRKLKTERQRRGLLMVVAARTINSVFIHSMRSPHDVSRLSLITSSDLTDRLQGTMK